MNTQKNLMVLIVALTIFMSAPLVAAMDSSSLRTTLLSYNPVPAEPGSYVTIRLQVANIGSSPTNEAVIELIDNYPFSVDQEASRVKRMGSISTGSYFLAEYRVRIDSQALEGTNYLKIRTATDSAKENWIEQSIPLSISAASQRTVTIKQVKITPDVVTPGEKASVTLVVQNVAGSTLRDISVMLDLSKQVIGTQVIDLPFAPIGSSTEKRKASISGGESTDFTFTLQTYPEATSGIYKVPIRLGYTDERGNEYTRTDMISIVVSGPADLLVQADTTTLRTAGGKGNIVFSVTNKGLDRVKFMTMTLGEGEGYTISSVSNQAYLGNIDSDDYNTASFELEVAPGLDSISVPLTITYKDSLNQPFEKRAQLLIPLRANGGNGGATTSLIIIVLIVVLIISVIVYRRKKAKQKNRS